MKKLIKEGGIRNIRKLSKRYDKAKIYFHQDLDGVTTALAMKNYLENNVKKENLTDEEHYFISETINDFKKSGLDLPKEKLDKEKHLKKLEKHISDHSEIINGLKSMVGALGVCSQKEKKV